MQIAIKGPQKDNIRNLMRKTGYFNQNEAFVRPFSKNGYPRFHIYIKSENDDLILDLHLDQKRPSYKGAAAHSGEYKGELVAQEIQRIKQILK